MSDRIELRAEHRLCGGRLQFYQHESATCAGPMRFSIFVPEGAGPMPVLYWLSGLTCTEENFMAKSGVGPLATEHGIIVVAPDTSPRGAGIAGEDDSWDFGTGAGFYVNATEPAWSKHYNMYDYVVRELPTLIDANFPTIPDRIAISGHSMGGHGAMVIGSRDSDRYRSVSAFAPIAHPIRVPWGQKAFSGYLGSDAASWEQYDTVCLLRQGKTPAALLVDYGTEDQFLAEQLSADLLYEVCREARVEAEVRMQDGYDHSYYFVSTFLPEHMRFHAAHLKA